MSFQHPEYLLFAFPLLLIWQLYLWRERATRWIRFVILLLVVLALADPRWSGETYERQITLLLDRSFSVRGEALKKGREIARLLAEKNPDLSYVLGFGREAGVLARPGEPLDTITEAASQDESNLTAGLRLAAGLAPSAGTQELLIISDGLYTGSDPLLEVPVLRKRGVRVHYLALDLRRHNDVAVSRLLTPSRSAVNQAFNIAAEIVSPARQPAICAKLRRISLNLLEKINLMI
ncbi:MAG: VWA domain-containing protein [Gammaproteobacteria bacterium]|nr:VWA domain-containing protein [Gammaproteobacteria bacterium]